MTKVKALKPFTGLNGNPINPGVIVELDNGLARNLILLGKATSELSASPPVPPAKRPPPVKPPAVPPAKPLPPMAAPPTVVRLPF